MSAEKQISAGDRSDLVMEAAEALAAENFERLDEIEATLIRAEQPNLAAWDAVKAFV